MNQSKYLMWDSKEDDVFPWKGPENLNLESHDWRYTELPAFLRIKTSKKWQTNEKKFSKGQFRLLLLTSSALISSEIQRKVINGKYNNTVRILWPFYQSKRFNYKRQCSEAYKSLKAFTRAQPYWIFSCSGLKLIYLLMISVSIYKWEFFQMWLLKDVITLYNNRLEEMLGQQCNLKRVFIVIIQFYLRKNLHLDCPSFNLHSEHTDFLHRQ